MRKQITPTANTSIHKLDYLLNRPALLVVSFCALLYFFSLWNSYNLDDELVTRGHPLTSKGIISIVDIFKSPYYADAMGYKYEYRPVVHVSFAIEHSLFGERPFASHLINLLLYSITCYLLLRVLTILFPTYKTANLIVSLLFAAHPLHTEVVCSIKNRDEVLSLLFAFTAWLTALKVSEHKHRWIYFVLMMLSFVLGMLSKNTAVIFILIIPISLIVIGNNMFKHVLLISFLLSTTAFLLLNINSNLSKLYITLGAVVCTVVYYIIHFRTWIDVFYKIRYHLNSIWLKLNKTIAEQQDVATSSLSFKSFRDYKQELHAELSGFKFSALLVFIPAIVLAFLGRFYMNGVLVSAALALPLPFILIPRISVYYKLTSAFSFAALYYYFGSLPLNPLILELAAMVLMSGVIRYYKNSTLLLVGYSILILLSFIFNDAQNAITYLLIILAISVSNKYVFYISLILIFAFSGASIYADFSEHLYFDSLMRITIFLGMLGMLAGKWYNHFLSKTFVFLHISIFIFVSGLYVSNNVYYGESILQNSTNAPAKNSNRDFTFYNIDTLKTTLKPSFNDRPLNFIESPVTNDSPIRDKISLSLASLNHYVLKLLVPYPMSFYYGYKVITIQPLNTPGIWIGAIILFLLLIIFLYYRKTDTPIAFFSLITLIAFTPFINLHTPLAGVVADRFALLPSIGFCALIGYGVFKLFKLTYTLPQKQLLKHKIPSFILFFLFVIYSTITIARNFQWKNHLTLMEHDIEYVDQSAQAHNLLALHLVKYSMDETDATKQTEMRKKAIYHFQRSQEIYPDFFNTHYDEGRVHVMLGQYDSALLAFKDAMRIDSTFGEAPKTIGDIYFEKQDFASAIPYYQKVIALMPDEYYAYEKVSYMYFMLKNYEQSIATNRLAARNLPALPDPYINIARTYVGMNRLDSATYYLQAALQVSPNNPGIQQMIQQLNQMQIQSGKSGR